MSPPPQKVKFIICKANVCVCVCVCGQAAAACRILILQPGMESASLALEVQNLNHWTIREVSLKMSF